MIAIEVICIGDELLQGRVRDANAAFLGAMLAERGAQLQSVRMVGDAPPDIVAALAQTSADLVVITGGLGPTADDRTRDAASSFFQSELVLDEASLEYIRARCAVRGQPFTDNNRAQALRPAAAVTLATEVGTAPGFEVMCDGRRFVFTPGVPHEFAWFMSKYVERSLGTAAVSQSLLQFYGIGESSLETRIQADVADSEEQGGSVGYRARFPVIEVKLSGERAWVEAARQRVTKTLAEFWIGEDDECLSARLGRILRARGETVTTAESCTAGGIAAMITDVSGSSAWFDRAYVTYANEAKIEEVGVSADTLREVGAVSERTVREMAVGALRRAGSTYALAVSGIAGPGGGTPDKPVGTVHFALATPKLVLHSHKCFAGRTRADVRTLTAYHALTMLLRHLEQGAE